MIYNRSPLSLLGQWAAIVVSGPFHSPMDCCLPVMVFQPTM